MGCLTEVNFALQGKNNLPEEFSGRLF